MFQRIEDRYDVGDKIECVNPRTGKMETGVITAYAKDQTKQTRNATGLMIRFKGESQSVEIDGDFLA